MNAAIDQQILPAINERIGHRPISILLVGVSNAGKSTLLSDFWKKYPDMIQVPEMAATYMREHQIHVNPEQMTPEVFNDISRTQIEAVNQAYHDNPELLELGT